MKIQKSITLDEDAVEFVEEMAKKDFMDFSSKLNQIILQFKRGDRKK